MKTASLDHTSLEARIETHFASGLGLSAPAPAAEALRT
jgi:hypothetical protein